METTSVSSAPALVVLAAGLSSRHGGVSLAEPVGPGGESIVDYSIYDACRAGFSRVVFVVRRANEQQFREMAHARFAVHVRCDFVLQDMLPLPPGIPITPGRTRLWGTTQAVLAAEPAVPGPFAVINVDEFYSAQSYRVLAAHLNTGTGNYAMAGFTLRNTLPESGAVPRALCKVDEFSYLREIVELKSVEREKGHAVSIDATGAETQLTGDEIVSTNMWGFPRTAFRQLKEIFQTFVEQHGGDPSAECPVPDGVNELLRTGKVHVRVFHMQDGWFGLTYGEDHPRAVEHIHRLIADGVYPRRLWAHAPTMAHTHA
jgi:hypothetical protein